MVVGHELTHSFDSQGRKFDEIGRLREWFSDQSAANFVRLADEVVQLYDGELGCLCSSHSLQFLGGDIV